MRLDAEVAFLTARDEIWWNVARITDIPHDHTTTRQDADPRYGRVIETETEPTLGRELQGPAHKVTNHIRMADDQLVAVLLLGRLCAMEEFPEGRFDAGTVLEELLKGRGRGQRVRIDIGNEFRLFNLPISRDASGRLVVLVGLERPPPTANSARQAHRAVTGR